MDFVRARKIRWLMIMALLAVVPAGAWALPYTGGGGASARPLVSLTTETQAAALSGCASAKLNAKAGVARWLEKCGTVAVSGSPEEIARRALASRANILGLRADGKDLDLLMVQESQDQTYVRFRQVYNGVPVYLGQTLVQYDRADAVQLINNHTQANLSLDVAPRVGAAQASQAAAQAVGGQLRAPEQVELVVFGEKGAPQLAWHVTRYTMDPLADWQVFVSATNGKVIDSWNDIKNDTGSGLIYDPNAVQQSGTTTLVDGNDATTVALDAARVTANLNNLNSGIGTLKGSYVDITAPGVTGCSLPYNPGAANEPTRVYNYDRSDDRFEEAMDYAAIDGVETWIQSLGFNNINNRSIPIDVHCIPDDNSYYSSGDHSLHMGDGGVDDSEDADIVIHEYGHSVHDNQVPGWGPGGGEQGAMGEGFGDFLAAMYYINKGNATFQNTYKYCVGEWDATSYNPVVGGDSGSGCLRWTDGRAESNGADIGDYSGTPSEVHDDGRFWSAALTCIYEGLGANAAARDDVTEMVLASHFSLTPDSSNDAFEDAVAALILADSNRLGGTHRNLIITCGMERHLITSVPIPTLATPTLTAPATGASYDAGSVLNITWNTNGAPVTATYTLEYSSNCVAAVDYLHDVESGSAGWTASHTGGTLDWTQATDQSHSATHSWFAGDEEATNSQFLVSPSIVVTADGQLTFWHNYDLEGGYDGGIVEISTNGGSTWTDLGPAMTENGYSITMDTGSAPLAGRDAFSGSSGGWIKTAADLSSYAGQTVKLRFFEGDDNSVAETGWWVDDIAIGATPVWTTIVSGTTGSSYAWTTPNVPGDNYCVRISGQAVGFHPSDVIATGVFSLTEATATEQLIYIPALVR